MQLICPSTFESFRFLQIGYRSEGRYPCLRELAFCNYASRCRRDSKFSVAAQDTPLIRPRPGDPADLVLSGRMIGLEPPGGPAPEKATGVQLARKVARS
jgi:hypothetical protein